MLNEQDIFNAHILIVDDIKTNVLLLEQMLSEAGYQNFTSTMDPCAVVELDRANHFDLILLDLQMPAMDGFQVMEALKISRVNDGPYILVISVKIEQKLRSLAAGAKDFIAKPFKIAEIASRIRTLLEANSLMKQRKISMPARQ